MLLPIFRNAPFFNVKIALQRSALGVVLLAHCRAGLSFADSKGIALQPPPSQTLCSASESLLLSVPENLERISPAPIGTLCAFRSKTGGFPTLNVILQPAPNDVRQPSLREREERLLESYKGVGLTDTVLTHSRLEVRNGLPAFIAIARYTNRGAPMISEILTVDLPDRSYIATATNVGAGPESGLKGVIDSISIEATNQAKETEGAGHFGVLWLFPPLVVAGLTYALIRTRKQRN